MLEPIAGGVLAALAAHNAAQWWKRHQQQKAPVKAVPVIMPVRKIHPVEAAQQ